MKQYFVYKTGFLTSFKGKMVCNGGQGKKKMHSVIKWRYKELASNPAEWRSGSVLGP